MTLLRTGRLLEHDERSKDFPAPSSPVHDVWWGNAGPRLDQGRMRACTGFAMAHALNCDPLHRMRHPYQNETNAIGLYSWATRLDGFPGNTYPWHDMGSSGLGVAKAAVRLGEITSYRWGFGFDHFLQAIQAGPCLIGGNWYAPMRHPDSRSFVDVSGALAGAHEWVAVAVNMDEEWVAGLNSWGEGWGRRGFFKVPFPGMRRILEEDGDVILPIRGTSATMGG